MGERTYQAEGQEGDETGDLDEGEDEAGGENDAGEVEEEEDGEEELGTCYVDDTHDGERL